MFTSVPFAYQFGPFAGRVVRASLQEMQKANIGRKYARKDKRPLDPPPVVRLHCHQTIPVASGHQFEQELRDFDEHLVFGFICHAELIQVSREGQIESDRRVEARSSCRSAMRQDAFELDRSMPRHYPAESTNPAFMPASVDHGIPGTISPYGMRGLSLDEYGCGPMSFDTAGRSAELWATRPKVSAEIQQQLSAASKSLDNQGFEDETCTHLLAGETFVPCSLVEYEGRRAAIFVFSDLAVKQEGRFIIRYRVFNICGTQVGTPSVPILTECYGGPFEIFSTKTFPGLPVSTDLTKRLSLSGFRVNSRHRERRHRKKPVRAQSYSSDSPTISTRSNSVGTLGPSRGFCRTPTRKPHYQLPMPPQYTSSFSGDFSYSMPLPQPVGLFGSDAEAARNALAEWHRREMRSDLAGPSRSAASPSGTDESGSGQSLW